MVNSSIDKPFNCVLSFIVSVIWLTNCLNKMSYYLPEFGLSQQCCANVYKRPVALSLTKFHPKKERKQILRNFSLKYFKKFKLISSSYPPPSTHCSLQASCSPWLIRNLLLSLRTTFVNTNTRVHKICLNPAWCLSVHNGSSAFVLSLIASW